MFFAALGTAIFMPAVAGAQSDPMVTDIYKADIIHVTQLDAMSWMQTDRSPLLLRPPVAANGPGPGHLGQRDRDEGEG